MGLFGGPSQTETAIPVPQEQASAAVTPAAEQHPAQAEVTAPFSFPKYGDAPVPVQPQEAPQPFKIPLSGGEGAAQPVPQETEPTAETPKPLTPLVEAEKPELQSVAEPTIEQSASAMAQEQPEPESGDSVPPAYDFSQPREQRTPDFPTAPEEPAPMAEATPVFGSEASDLSAGIPSAGNPEPITDAVPIGEGVEIIPDAVDEPAEKVIEPEPVTENAPSPVAEVVNPLEDTQNILGVEPPVESETSSEPTVDVDSKVMNAEQLRSQFETAAQETLDTIDSETDRIHRNLLELAEAHKEELTQNANERHKMSTEYSRKRKGMMDAVTDLTRKRQSVMRELSVVRDSKVDLTQRAERAA